MTTSLATLRLPTAEVFQPLLPHMRYKGAKGGRASAKTHFFGDSVIDYSCSYPGLRTVCIREVQKSLNLSSKLLLEDTIKQHKLRRLFDVKRDVIHSPGGGMIIFKGMQDQTAESIKSLEGFDVFWTDEAQKLSERSLRILRPTARSTARTVLPNGPELWFSWNPNDPKDPIDKFFKDKPPDSKLVTANWRDNPWFPKELLQEVEWDRRRDPEKYQHVWEGAYLAVSEARVFKNWKVEEFDVPEDAIFYMGADWGFSVDPSVLVACYIKDRTLYIAYEAWKVGCEVDQTPALFDKLDPERPGFARAWPITADSSRSDTISYMRRHGYSGISSARKGAGSVEDGIEFLKSYDIIIHPRCVHTADEFTFYSYKVDKLTEKVLPILADKKNHTIDSIRYAVEGVRWAVQGDSMSSPSEMSKKYDGAIAVERRREEREAEDLPAQFAGISFESHEYDGGLT